MTRRTYEDRTVLVTGGTGGLGRAICLAFADAGARVYSGDVAAPAADADPRVRHLTLDVTQEAAWVSALDTIEAEAGALDILVNNAGFYRPNIPFEEMPLALWQRHFAINADGVFLGCQQAIRRMRARRSGAIVNMASGLAITANPLGAAYCASKAAVLMTTRTAAAAAGPHGIRVNAILPGAVATEMLMGNLRDGEDEGDFLERMRGFSPLGRLATPADIARAVLFLADPSNGAISGIHLPVDGGNMPGS